MTEQLSFNNFGFIGFGLIGGSIAHALKEIYPSSNIIAYNYYKIKTHKKLEAAKQDGIVDNISTSLSDFSDCDVIFLCAPVLTNISYLNELSPYISENCLLTDVGSVKGNIHKAVAELGLNKNFIGALKKPDMQTPTHHILKMPTTFSLRLRKSRLNILHGLKIL